ncbi:hypothetical protein D1871_00100 [Nakamurella silvestris]|nr:hypothetical protein D1871_00100 [Nakamurella silvestris]
MDSWVAERLGVVLETGSSPVGLELSDLVGVAVRQNPRRAHLLVSTVLGKHIPVDPRLVHGAGLLLGLLVRRVLESVTDPVPASWPQAARAALDGHPEALLNVIDTEELPVLDVLVVGFAETATGLGHSVADALRAPYYLHSTRREVPGVTPTGTFEEGHSHASTHLLSPLPGEVLSGDLPMILVDDEFSTGRTLMATISALQQQFPRSGYVVAALVDLRSAEADEELRTFARELGVTIEVVSLVSGRVHLPAGILTDAADLMQSLPVVGSVPGAVPAGPGSSAPISRVQIDWPADVPDGGRHGFLGSDRAGFRAGVDRIVAALAPELSSYQRVLLLGTEEFMYLPHMVGVRLTETTGLDVRYQTTTRSPVFPVDDPGYPVRRRVAFVDPEGDTVVDRYLNNALWLDGAGLDFTEADVVVVLVDGPADTDLLYGPRGLVTVVASWGVPVVLAAVTGADPVRTGLQRSTERGSVDDGSA